MGGKSGELHLPIRIGSGFQIEPPHSTKTIRNVNLDGGGVKGFAVRAHNRKFEGTGTGTALYDGNFFVVRWRLSLRKQRDCDKNGAQNTKHSVHMRTIIRAQPGSLGSLSISRPNPVLLSFRFEARTFMRLRQHRCARDEFTLSGDLQDDLAPSVSRFIEFVSVPSFGQRQHSLNYRFDFPRIDKRCPNEEMVIGVAGDSGVPMVGDVWTSLRMTLLGFLAPASRRWRGISNYGQSRLGVQFFRRRRGSSASDKPRFGNF